MILLQLQNNLIFPYNWVLLEVEQLLTFCVYHISSKLARIVLVNWD